jgi:ribosome-binding factor A
MASNKIQRINDDIQFCLSGLLRQIKDPRVNQGTLLSITRVETTGDLRFCKVYISALGQINEKDFLKGLRSAQPWLRRELGQSLDLRYTPELQFELDHSIEHGSHINDIISKLNAGESNGEN